MKVNVVACGGGGTGVLTDIVKELNSDSVNARLFKDKSVMPEIAFHIFDTAEPDDFVSVANDISFHKVNTGKIGDKTDGAGGLQIKALEPAQRSIPPILNGLNWNVSQPDEMFIILTSGSGGSGNVIGQVLYKHLMDVNAYAIPFIITDAETVFTVGNSINTIKAFNNVAVKSNKVGALSLIQNDLHVTPGTVDKTNKYKAVNEIILNKIMNMSLFMSGNNNGLDTEDIKTIIHFGAYKAVDVSPGIYCLDMFAKKKDQGIDDIKDAMAIRTLSDDVNVKVPEEIANTAQIKQGTFNKNYMSFDIPGIGDNVLWMVLRSSVVKNELDRLESLKKDVKHDNGLGGSEITSDEDLY